MKYTKEPVRLRQRRTPTGRISLYLDIYINGHRSYEYLRLYLIPEKSRADKDKNRQTLQLAEAIKSKRVIEIQNGQYGFAPPVKANTLLLPYFQNLCNQHTTSAGCHGSWLSTLKLLEGYCRPRTTLRDITPEWIKGFKNYLDRAVPANSHNAQLTSGTKSTYFSKVRACLRQAQIDGLINTNPCLGIENYAPSANRRVYLTLDELRTLAATPCPRDVVKRAFLFSCLTGLRRSDIYNLRWGDVVHQGKYTRIIFTQQKTRQLEYLDISPEAESYLGPRNNDDELVFKGLKSISTLAINLTKWVQLACINKHITFHSGRHTFAVLMLDLGADLYTVSKLLGHREIKTTQVYAHMLDKRKQEAVDMIPHLGPSLDGE